MRKSTLEAWKRQKEAEKHVLPGRTQVQYPAWIPTLHPMTGQYQHVLCNIIDRLVTTEQAAKLEAWFALSAFEEE